MFLKPNRIIGLDVDDKHVVAAELWKKASGNYQLNKFLIANNLQELKAGLSSKGPLAVIVNMPSQAILLRSFMVAPSLMKKAQDLAAFLARQNLPFKLEDCFWDTFSWGQQLNLVAARKDMVQRQLGPIREAGLEIAGVNAPQAALYNVFIQNYPDKEKFIILNVKGSSSDILIFEKRRFWNYPLSTGHSELEQDKEEMDRFTQEVQRITSSHYLQNPQNLGKPGENIIYLAGHYPVDKLIAALKAALADYEVMALEPFKKIALGAVARPAAAEELCLSVGLGLGYLETPRAIAVNLIRSSLKRQADTAHAEQLKKSLFYLAASMALILLLWDAKIISALKKESALKAELRAQMAKALPEMKLLAEEKDRLKKLEGFLSLKLAEQNNYLEALAAIAASRPASLKIKEFSAQLKEGKFSVLLSGTSLNYEEMNKFVTSLKKQESISEVKIVASSFPDASSQGKPVDFNLRFEIPAQKVS